MIELKKTIPNYKPVFTEWLQENHPQISRPDKYGATITTISNDLKSFSNIGDIFQIINPITLEELKKLYFSNPEFEAKNSRGNRMYSRAFDLYIQFASSNNLGKDILNIIRGDQKDTVKETLILARIGQGRFRNDLIKIWDGCSITGYPDTSLLVASHIKPWSHSNNDEKLDPYNGLLLLPNYDKLFDKGLISFDHNGKIMISDQLEDYELLGIRTDMKIDLKEQNKRYLKYHSERVLLT